MQRKIVIGFIKMVWKLYAKNAATEYVLSTDNEFDDEALDVLDKIISMLE